MNSINNPSSIGPEPPSEEVLKKTLEASVKRVRYVYAQIRKHYTPLKPHMNAGTREYLIAVMRFRVMAWMSTLRKLDHMCDTQAALCGLRTLLELTTDMLLLHHDKTNESVLKMNAWSESAKLKCIELSVEFTDRRKEASGKRMFYLPEFVERKRREVDKSRRSFWPQNGTRIKHPERWTGRTNLLSDIRTVDSYFTQDIHRFLGRALEELYETEYRSWNWFVHGSGLAGFSQHHHSLYLFSSISLDTSVRLALLCSEVYLRETQFDDTERKSSLFAELELLRKKIDREISGLS